MRSAIRAALFTRRGDIRRTSSYPTNDGLNFEGIDFPTPVSQIDRLERQNPNLAINVFGWDKEQVIVHRISEQDGNIPRINLMITKQGEAMSEAMESFLVHSTTGGETPFTCF